MTGRIDGDLLQALQGADDPQAAMLNALASSGRIAPDKLHLVQKMMAQSSEAATPEADSDAGDVVDMDSEPHTPIVPRYVAQLIAAAEQRLGLLEGLIESVGDAIGACPSCLGADAACDDCDGDGHPGTWVPDTEAFSNLVLPALRRLKRSHRRKAVKRSTVADHATTKATSNPSKTGKE